MSALVAKRPPPCIPRSPARSYRIKAHTSASQVPAPPRRRKSWQKRQLLRGQHPRGLLSKRESPLGNLSAMSMPLPSSSTITTGPSLPSAPADPNHAAAAFPAAVRTSGSSMPWTMELRIRCVSTPPSTLGKARRNAHFAPLHRETSRLPSRSAHVGTRLSKLAVDSPRGREASLAVTWPSWSCLSPTNRQELEHVGALDGDLVEGRLARGRRRDENVAVLDRAPRVERSKLASSAEWTEPVVANPSPRARARSSSSSSSSFALSRLEVAHIESLGLALDGVHVAEQFVDLRRREGPYRRADDLETAGDPLARAFDERDEHLRAAGQEAPHRRHLPRVVLFARLHLALELRCSLTSVARSITRFTLPLLATGRNSSTRGMGSASPLGDEHFEGASVANSFHSSSRTLNADARPLAKAWASTSCSVADG